MKQKIYSFTIIFKKFNKIFFKKEMKKKKSKIRIH